MHLSSFKHALFFFFFTESLVPDRGPAGNFPTIIHQRWCFHEAHLHLHSQGARCPQLQLPHPITSPLWPGPPGSQLPPAMTMSLGGSEVGSGIRLPCSNPRSATYLLGDLGQASNLSSLSSHFIIGTSSAGLVSISYSGSRDVFSAMSSPWNIPQKCKLLVLPSWLGQVLLIRRDRDHMLV